jgi:endonuclease III
MTEPAKKPAARRSPAKKKRLPPGLTREQAEELFARLSEVMPDPKTELNYTNPFTLTVAVALSAQATDVGVNKATKALFEAADTPEKMLALGEDAVRDHIKTIGLFRNKAKNVIAMSRILVEQFGGEVPRSR